MTPLLLSVAPFLTGLFLLLGVGVYVSLLCVPSALCQYAGAVGSMLLLWSPFGIFRP